MTILLLCLFLLLPVAVGAETYTQTGAVVEAAYTEPTVTAVGTPLTDLDHTTVYYEKGAGPVAATTIPATALTGGGQITTSVEVPLAVNEEVDVRFFTTATDTTGNESAASVGATKRLDKLPPGPPQ